MFVFVVAADAATAVFDNNGLVIVALAAICVPAAGDFLSAVVVFRVFFDADLATVLGMPVTLSLLLLLLVNVGCC